MNKCVWLLLGFIVFTVIVIYIIYLCNLHGRVSRLERSASPRLEIIEREIHGIGFYMRIIVGLAIFFCVSICIHYLIYCYPRYIPPQQTGFDYLGVIIAILGVIVTFLVTWQIYSTIRAKEEIRVIRDDFDRQIKNIASTEADRAANEATFISLSQLGNSLFHRIGINSGNPNVEEALLSLSMFTNAAALWRKEFSTPLSQESFGYVRPRLNQLARLFNSDENHGIILDSEDERDVYTRAALNIGDPEYSELVLNIRVESNPGTSGTTENTNH